MARNISALCGAEVLLQGGGHIGLAQAAEAPRRRIAIAVLGPVEPSNSPEVFWSCLGDETFQKCATIVDPPFGNIAVQAHPDRIGGNHLTPSFARKSTEPRRKSPEIGHDTVVDATRQGKPHPTDGRPTGCDEVRDVPAGKVLGDLAMFRNVALLANRDKEICGEDVS